MTFQPHMQQFSSTQFNSVAAGGLWNSSPSFHIFIFFSFHFILMWCTQQSFISLCARRLVFFISSSCLFYAAEIYFFELMHSVLSILFIFPPGRPTYVDLHTQVWLVQFPFDFTWLHQGHGILLMAFCYTVHIMEQSQ